MRSIYLSASLLISLAAFTQNGIDPARLDSLTRSIAGHSESNRRYTDSVFQAQDSIQRHRRIGNVSIGKTFLGRNAEKKKQKEAEANAMIWFALALIVITIGLMYLWRKRVSRR